MGWTEDGSQSLVIYIPVHVTIAGRKRLRPDSEDLYKIQLQLLQHYSVQSLSCVRLFATPWTIARQSSLSITNSRSLLKLILIELVMPSNHLILCHPLLLLPLTLPSIRVFSNESALHITWRKYWSFSFNISPSNELRTNFL